MNADEYQELACQFATYGGNSMYPALGLAEEAGEVCGKIAKYIRRNNGFVPAVGALEEVSHSEQFKDDAAFRDDIKKELGDCLWMIAALCGEYDMKLSDVMQCNIAKLTDRRNRGVIVGEGDNR